MSTSGLIGVEIPTSDPDIVAFIATGSREVTIHASKKWAFACAALIGTESLRGQLEASVWEPRLLKPRGARLKKGSTIRLYCHGVFRLPDTQWLLVLVGRAAPLSDGWLSRALKAEVETLYAAHRVEMVKFEDGIRREQEKNEQFCNRQPEMKRKMAAMETHHQPPVLPAEPLLPFFPPATT